MSTAPQQPETQTDEMTATLDATQAENTDSAIEAPAEDTILDPAAELQAAIEAGVAEWKDRYQRLGAEFENYKKRMSRDFDFRLELAKENLIQSFLPIFDDVERTLKVAEASTDLETIQNGIRLVVKNYNSILEKQGIVAVSSVGEVFNSEIHEAITTAPAPDPEQKGKVMQEIRKGYRYQDKLIRTAQVIIGE